MTAESCAPAWPGLYGGVRRKSALAAWLRMVAARDGRRGAGKQHGGPFAKVSGGGGFGGGFPPGFGFGGPLGWWRGGPPHFAGGRRVRRGDVRAAALALLAEQPRNGYQIIQEVAERSGGVWRPSAGSVYPVLQQLEDEGLARAVADGSRRVFELTEEGRAYVAAHPEECAAPWEAVRGTVGEDALEVGDLLRKMHLAAMQVMQAGSPSQVDQMRAVLTETRQALYRILATEDAEGADGADGAEGADRDG